MLPDIEVVSAAVHAAWMDSKRAQGVTTRKAEDGEELMAPYEQLSEKAKQLDRGTVQAVYAAISASASENRTQLPDPEVDFGGFVDGVATEVMADVEKHPPEKEPEYWVAKAAARLARLKGVDAPTVLLEMAKRTLAKRVAALPIYCADYDEINKEVGNE